jgi:hypothetical protein
VRGEQLQETIVSRIVVRRQRKPILLHRPAVFAKRIEKNRGGAGCPGCNSELTPCRYVWVDGGALAKRPPRAVGHQSCLSGIGLDSVRRTR